MSAEKFILALDQGTSSSRAMIVDKSGDIVASSQKEFTQIYPKNGWVEHDPQEILESQFSVAKALVEKVGSDNIAAIGITNQRESSVLWDRRTGKPIYNVIVWQDRRGAAVCDSLRAQGKEALLKQKTGLLADAYFSATKIQWILDNVEGARAKAERGELCFGTIDTWLIWNLTKGRSHLTDVTNACRTLLFNIHSLNWDKELLELFRVPESLLPQVKECADSFGIADASFFGSEIPITGVAGDQQAATFGQMCTEKGMVKNTYGTGCFIVMNTGSDAIESKNRLLTTLAWRLNGQTSYALEGSIFMGGATVQWLRDGLEIIASSSEVEALASSVEDNGGVYLVPAFTGLGAPHWDPYASATLIGMSRSTGKAHIARAALESIAYQTLDVVDAMIADSGISLKQLRVDGGASVNDLLMQYQADVLGVEVIRPKSLETTVLGAAFFAGLQVGFWESLDEIKALWQQQKSFSPSELKPESALAKWKKAVARAKSWIDA